MTKKTFTSDVCLTCSKKYGSCCENDPYVPLTLIDIKRLKKLGYRLRQFAEIENYHKKDIIGPEKWWLNSFIKIKNKNYRLILKKDKNKSCVFLKKGKGCELGKNRPV